MQICKPKYLYFLAKIGIIIFIITGMQFSSVASEGDVMDVPKPPDRVTPKLIDCARSAMGCWVVVTRNVTLVLTNENDIPLEDTSNIEVECLENSGKIITASQKPSELYEPEAIQIEYAKEFPYGGAGARRTPVCPQIEIKDNSGVYQTLLFKAPVPKGGSDYMTPIDYFRISLKKN